MIDGKFFLAGALALALGIGAAGFHVGNALMRMNDTRTVTVKGLVEKPVRADFVSWPLSFIASGNDLAEVTKRVNENQKILTDFLTSNGLIADDYSVGQWRVVDQNANEYGSGAQQGRDRFIIYAGVTVNTDKVDTVLALTLRAPELVEKGVVLSNSSASFRFNGLNSIKPELIAEATRNARQSAEQFAKDSGSEVGAIVRANQGVISILSKGSDMDDPAVADKVVRVVTTLDYMLEQD